MKDKNSIEDLVPNTLEKRILVALFCCYKIETSELKNKEKAIGLFISLIENSISPTLLEILLEKYDYKREEVTKEIEILNKAHSIFK